MLIIEIRLSEEKIAEALAPYSQTAPPGNEEVLPDGTFGISMPPEPENLSQLLDQIDLAARRDKAQITLGDILSACGRRSFAPILLLFGILIASPLSGIPLFPTLSAIVIVLVSIQLLVGRPHFWLPGWLLRRSLEQRRLAGTVCRLRPVARKVDKFLKPRLPYLVHGTSQYFMALGCLLLAMTMPVMELIPFSSSAAGVTFAAFGLSLISHDGVPALIAYLFAALTAALIVMNVF